MSLSNKDYEITLNWYDHQVAQAIENRKRFMKENGKSSPHFQLVQLSTTCGEPPIDLVVKLDLVPEHHMIPGETKEIYQARLKALGYPK